MNRYLAFGALFGIFAVGMVRPAIAKEPAPTQQVAMKSIALRVDKMACSACAARVTNVLQQMNGVKRATVSAETKGAIVEYDPARVTPKQMVDAINSIGFQASLAM